MCTALHLNHYFGRNLDLEKSFGERVCITPRHYPFSFRKLKPLNTHYAMIGMALVEEDYPLYFDATNEYGLSMAGLNFPDLATYYKEDEDRLNIAPFELIPYLLGKYKSVQEVKEALQEINIVNIDFSEGFQLSPLHWLIADQKEAIVLETVKDGMKIYDNPIGVLTNAPAFDQQVFNLNNYQHLSTQAPQNHFSPSLNLNTYSYGMGALGLPGDLSSMSRFVRIAYYKLNSFNEKTKSSEMNHFFKLLESVYQIKGANQIREGIFEYTVYSSCVDMDQGIYCLKRYEDPIVQMFDMHQYDLDQDRLIKL